MEEEERKESRKTDGEGGMNENIKCGKEETNKGRKKYKTGRKKNR